jgi:hypothetical protein
MQTHLKYGILASLLAVFAAPAHANDYAGQNGLQQQFEFWTLNCDETLKCVTDSYAKLPNGNWFRLALERDGAANADVTLIIQPQILPEKGGTVRLRMPEADYGMFGSVKRSYEEGAAMRFSEFALSDNLFKALPNATYAIGVLEDANGEEQQAEFWLNGLTETLIYMDNHQGRIGRVDALIARGGQPIDAGLKRIPLLIDTETGDARSPDYQAAPKVAEAAKPKPAPVAAPAPTPAPAPQPVSEPFLEHRVPIVKVQTLSSTKQLPRFVKEAVANGPDCNLQETLSIGGGRKLFINDDYIIWELPCFLGAYQASTVYVNSYGHGDDMSASMMLFYGPPTRDYSDTSEMLGVEFDVKSSVLTSWAVNRGSGDCGVYQKHELIYAEGEIVDFALMELREKSTCDGVATEGKDYPLVWKQDGY